jgi:cytochrome P450
MIVMIEAGSETTLLTLNSCILYLCKNPEVQSIAQQELDEALQGRPPTLIEDERSLPYCRSITKEILRLRLIADIGSPRRSGEDVVYKKHLYPQRCKYHVIPIRNPL